MAEPVKHDTLSEVSTIGSRALTGMIVGALVVGAAAAGLGALVATQVGLGAIAGLAATVAGIAGLWAGGAYGGMVGGAAGALTGISKTSEENNLYHARLRQQELARANSAGKAKDSGMQEGVMLGYQQASMDMQASFQQQAQVIYQQGVQAGAQHVVEELQKQQGAAMAAAEPAESAPAKSHVEKAGCKKCDSHLQAAQESKAVAANNQLAV